MAECSENMFLESGSFKSVNFGAFKCLSWKRVFQERNAAQNPQHIIKVKARDFVVTVIKKTRRSGDEHDQRNGDTRIHN